MARVGEENFSISRHVHDRFLAMIADQYGGGAGCYEVARGYEWGQGRFGGQW